MSQAAFLHGWNALQLRRSPLIWEPPRPQKSELYDTRKYPMAALLLLLRDYSNPLALPPELRPKSVRPANAHSARPGRPAPPRAKLTDVPGLVRHVGNDPITGAAVKGAAAYKQGKLPFDMGAALAGVSPSFASMLLVDAAVKRLPKPVRKYADIVRGAGRKVARWADPVDKVASAVVWLDAEARFARGESKERDVWLARAGMALTALSMVPIPQVAAPATAVGAGLDSYQLGQEVTRADGRPRAGGGRVRHGETTLVGERGPEIVRLPAGSDVVPAHRSRELLERPQAVSSALESRRDLHLHQHLDGREIARSTVRNLDDDEQWGRQ